MYHLTDVSKKPFNKGFLYNIGRYLLMDKNSVKCPRCGREYQFTIKQVFEGVNCPHCKMKMMLDKKSKRRLRIFRYIVVFAICAGAMLAIQDTLEKNYVIGMLLVIGLLALMYLFSQYADRLCGRIVYHTFGLQYVEYVEEQKGGKR